MSKRIILLVSNDISTDQRVHKTCKSLMEFGHKVRVVGRTRPHSMPLERDYPTERFKLWFDKGPLFYLELNIRLFFRLMKKDWDVVHVNDLDTLLSGHLGYSSFRESEIVYDSHEFFTEVPELKGRFSRKVWLAIERYIFPKLKHVYTVSDSIAEYYSKTYGVDVGLVRNVPPKVDWKREKNRPELGLPEDKRILVLQGAGINVSKGAEEAVLAMSHLSEDYVLLFVGSGDVFAALQELAKLYKVSSRVMFRDRMPYEDMMQYTLNADLGLSLEKADNLNYEYALPNKIFDYIAAGIPVIGGPTIESKTLVAKYKIGRSLAAIEPKEIAETVNEIFADVAAMQAYRQAASRAYEDLNWEKESKSLQKIYEDIG